MRDLVKWCQRASEVLGKESSEQIPEKLYQDVVDIFCNFNPDIIIRMLVGEEIAITFNISKERASRAVTNSEPVLLVGETVVENITSVQFLAEKTGTKLKIVNMNQQSDSADLLGGFKPVSLSRSLHSLRELFTSVFCDTFSSSDNAKFLGME